MSLSSFAGHVVAALAHLLGAARAIFGDSFDPDTIATDIWTLIYNDLLQPIISAVGYLFQSILGSFGVAISEMFDQWGIALGTYGIWGPVMAVLVLGIAAVAGYLLMDVFTGEEKVAEAESDL